MIPGEWTPIPPIAVMKPSVTASEYAGATDAVPITRFERNEIAPGFSPLSAIAGFRPAPSRLATLIGAPTISGAGGADQRDRYAGPAHPDVRSLPRHSATVEGMQPGVSRALLDLHGPERFVPLRRQLGVSTFGMNLILMQPGERGRIHRHTRQEEVYLVMEGTLSLGVEGQESDFAVHDLVRVAPEVRRQLVNRGPGRLVLLALGGALEHAGRDAEAFTAWEATESAPPQQTPMPPDLPAQELRA